ncbi:type II secretion system F family protein [Brevibacillus sp. SYSU BS000544]|uniref:type II secretion system F family protein n=1 Tax=Brevibacillus sp. SYSU BS000544 TaxID=3416443 RepID=UPI003CE5BB9F
MSFILLLSLGVFVFTVMAFYPVSKMNWNDPHDKEHVVGKQIKIRQRTILANLEQKYQLSLIGLKGTHLLALVGGTGGLTVFLSQQILDSWILSLPTSVLGFLISQRIIVFLLNRHNERFEEGNIRAFRIMAGSLRTNPSYSHAFQSVVDSAFVPKIVREEYQRVVKLLRGQISLERALEEMQERTRSSDIAYFTTILLVQKELGGDMAKTLDAAATMVVRRRQMQRRHRSALSQLLAQVNLLSIMPFIFVGTLFHNNPHHFDPLTATLQGKLLILGAFISIIFGGELIRHIALQPLRKREGNSK